MFPLDTGVTGQYLSRCYRSVPQGAANVTPSHVRPSASEEHSNDHSSDHGTTGPQPSTTTARTRRSFLVVSIGRAQTRQSHGDGADDVARPRGQRPKSACRDLLHATRICRAAHHRRNAGESTRRRLHPHARHPFGGASCRVEDGHRRSSSRRRKDFRAAMAWEDVASDFHDGALPVAPSALPVDGEAFTTGKTKIVTPRALETHEIPGALRIPQRRRKRKGAASMVSNCTAPTDTSRPIPARRLQPPHRCLRRKPTQPRAVPA